MQYLFPAVDIGSCAMAERMSPAHPGLGVGGSHLPAIEAPLILVGHLTHCMGLGGVSEESHLVLGGVCTE